MKVAVIGGGATGLFLSKLLSEIDAVEVTLFEKNRLGGNIYPVFVEGAGYVDLGFMVFNPDFYPIFYKFINEKNFDLTSVSMSFSITSENFSWSSNWLGHLNSLNFVGFTEWLRLNRDLFYLYKNLSKYENLKPPITSLIEDQKISVFASRVLLPLVCTLWSVDYRNLELIPTSYVLRFLKNHKMLSLFRKVRWHTFKNSSLDYLNSLISRKVKYRLEPVREVMRAKNGSFNGVVVYTPQGANNFDLVCFCCDPDQLKLLLKDPSPAEEVFLAKLKCSENKIYLHKDSRFLPPNLTSASWNFFDSSRSKFVTYDLGKLQNKPGLFVTLNPPTPPKDQLFCATLKHPIWSPRFEGKDLDFFSDQPNTYFAGAYFGWCFQEDALRSAVAVFKSIVSNRLPQQKNLRYASFLGTW